MTGPLRCEGLGAGHGAVEVVRDLTFTVEPGTVTALLGPNGAGKTTTLMTLVGLLPRMSGIVSFDGEPLPSGDPVAAGRRGITLVPDDRSLFPELTVHEHLMLACRGHSRQPRGLLDVFPALDKRWEVPAGALSGGEQQMLAMARGLAQDPQVLLIDEMSMGLAPVIVEDLLPVVRRISADHGASVVLVEQHIALALEVSDQAMVMVHGEVTLAGSAADLAADPATLESAYLG